MRAQQASFDRGLERKAAELLDPPEPAVIPEPEPEPVPPGKTVAPDEGRGGIACDTSARNAPNPNMRR